MHTGLICCILQDLTSHLNVADVLPVPQRLKQQVGKPEHLQHKLHSYESSILLCCAGIRPVKFVTSERQQLQDVPHPPPKP